MQRRVVFEISIHAPREGGDDKFPRSQLGLAVISIHAPREGGDAADMEETKRQAAFQSTPPARGATLLTEYEAATGLFQSTPPARGATAILA